MSVLTGKNSYDVKPLHDVVNTDDTEKNVIGQLKQTYDTSTLKPLGHQNTRSHILAFIWLVWGEGGACSSSIIRVAFTPLTLMI